MEVIKLFIQNIKKSYQFVFVHGYGDGGKSIKRYMMRTMMLLRIILEHIYWQIPAKIRPSPNKIHKTYRKVRSFSRKFHSVGFLFFLFFRTRGSFFEVHIGGSQIDSDKKTILTVMSCFNQLEYSRQALNSYYDSLDTHFNYIFLVTDDHSTDGTQAFFTQEVAHRKNMYYFRYKTNFGLTHAWNHSIHFGLINLKADYIFLINNDVIISPGSLSNMVSHLDQNPDVGVIGPLSNSPGHQTAQDIRRFLKKYWPSDSVENIYNTNALLRKNSPVKIPFVNGFFMGFPANIFGKMVFTWAWRPYYFDPINRNYHNESEFQRRLKKKSLQSIIATDVFVFHYKDISQKSLSNFSEKVYRKTLVPQNSIDKSSQQFKILQMLQDTQPVIIIGMHRSGTSLVSRILAAGGIHVGSDLESNNESKYFQYLNDILLSRTNSKWWNIQDFSTHAHNAEFIEDQKIFLENLLLNDVTSEHGSSFFSRYFDGVNISQFINQDNICWGFKDPRFTITLPIWLKIFPKARVLHVIRNGVDAALSLSARSQDEIGQGFCNAPITENLQYSFHLWEQYVSFGRSFRDILPDNQYSEIRYEELLQDPKMLFHILENWGLDFNTETAGDIVQSINQDRLQFNSRSIGNIQTIKKLLESPVMQELGYSYNLPTEESPTHVTHTTEKSPKHYLSICAIFKNEATYLKEWIEFHRLVGVEKFYLYNNNSTDNYLEILEPYIQNDIVVLTQWPTKPGQIPAYNDCIARFRNNSYWMAFIDIDEFLFGTYEDNLPTLLKNYEAYPGIEINWLVFGSSGYITRPPGLVTQNYIWRAHYQISQGDIGTWSPCTTTQCGFVTKSIVRMDAVIGALNPHIFVYKNKIFPVNPSCEFQNSSLTMFLDVDVIRINHYFCKSYEEMQSRIAKGSATGREKNIRLSPGVDRNEIEDDTIMRFLPKLKENMDGA